MDYSVLGMNIHHFRNKKNMTLEACANACGITKDHFSRIEAGTAMTRVSTFIKICNALEISPDILFQGASKAHSINAIISYMTLLDGDMAGKTIDDIAILIKELQKDESY